MSERPAQFRFFRTYAMIAIYGVFVTGYSTTDKILFVRPQRRIKWIHTAKLF